METRALNELVVGNTSLIKVSQVFHAGQVPSEALPHAVVAHLVPFFRVFDEMLQQLINVRQTFSNDHLGKVCLPMFALLF